MDIKEILDKPGVKEKVEDYKKLKKKVKEEWGKDGSVHYYKALECRLKQGAVELAGIIVDAVIEENS